VFFVWLFWFALIIIDQGSSWWKADQSLEVSAIFSERMTIPKA